MDLDLEASSSDFSINVDDAPDDKDSFLQSHLFQSCSVNLSQILPQLQASKQSQGHSQERTFEKGDKPRDMDKLKNMSYRFMVTQMMEHKGITKHGEKVDEALMKEYDQLDEFKVFKPLDSASRSKKENSRALRVINLVKEKRDSLLKG